MKIVMYCDGYYLYWVMSLVKYFYQHPETKTEYQFVLICWKQESREKISRDLGNLASQIPIYCIQDWVKSRWDSHVVEPERVQQIEAELGHALTWFCLGLYQWDEIFKTRYHGITREETNEGYLKRVVLTHGCVKHILKEERPDFVFLEQPGGLHSHIFQILCEKQNIPCFWLRGAYFNHVLGFVTLEGEAPLFDYFFSHVSEISPEIREDAEQFLKTFWNNDDIAPTEKRGEQLAPAAITFNTNLRLQWKNGVKLLKELWHYQRMAPQDRFLNFYRYPLDVLRNRVLSKFRVKYLIRECEHYPTKTEPYILFLLSRQPEASTYGLAPFYFDMQYVARMLSICLPATHKLYIKDHRTQFVKSVARGKSFFEDLTYYSNIKIIHPFKNTKSLMRNASAIVTTSGTAGIEAILLNKPVVLFGKAFYQNHPKVHVVTDITQLHQILTRAIYNCPDLPQEDLIDFAACLKASAFPGNIRTVEAGLPENIEQLRQGFVKFIQFINEGRPTF